MTLRNVHPHTAWLLQSPARLYDWHAGWLLSRRFLRLTHVGRKSGRQYRTILEAIATDPATHEIFVLVGQGPQADWYRNLRANPAVELATGRQRYVPDHRVVPEDEAAAVLADYERRNRLVAPLVRRVLSWLVGWSYDGSDAARRRLVRERPIVAFRPAG